MYTKIYYTLRWRRNEMKNGEMEKMARKLIKTGNESEIVNQVKKMMERHDLASI